MDTCYKPCANGTTKNEDRRNQLIEQAGASMTRDNEIIVKEYGFIIVHHIWDSPKLYANDATKRIKKTEFD